jgi:hypothetical protein
MRWETIIDEEGKITDHVLDREGQDCANIERISNSISTGKKVSEEKTGPDCDRVDEIQGN